MERKKVISYWELLPADDIKGKDGGDVIPARTTIKYMAERRRLIQAGFGNDNIHAMMETMPFSGEQTMIT